MNITITHTIAPEVINLLEKLLNNVGNTATPKETAPVKKSSVKKPDSEPAADPINPVAQVESEAIVINAEAIVTNTEPVTIEAIRAAVNEKAQNGKKDTIKTLLTEYGTPNVTNLPKEKYTEFLTKVKAL